MIRGLTLWLAALFVQWRCLGPLLSVMRTAAPQWGRDAATFREDGRGANSVIGIGQEISDCYSEKSYPTKLRYEARASISFGDNLLAIRGMGSAAASNPSPHCSSLLFK